MWSQEFDSMIPVGPSQLRIYCDSVNTDSSEEEKCGPVLTIFGGNNRKNNVIFRTA